MAGAAPRNPTAGVGDPYWYEWAVGLLYVVEMIDPDSGIVAVNFQTCGVKGFDDVVVTRENGAVIAHQVKHTRSGDPLALGDLVGRDREGRSLLSSLATAWDSARTKAADLSPVLYTNRPFGATATSTRPAEGTGIYRPALSEFWPELKRQLGKARNLQEVDLDDRWTPAWSEVVGELAVLPGDAVRFQFLSALELRAGEPSFDALEQQLRSELVRLFHVTVGTGGSLLDTLFASLRHWTLAHSAPVTRETVYEALSATERRNIGRHHLPPPAPFFESREDLVGQLEDLLDGRASVVFLTGPPGSGKTSVVSRLANRREPRAQLRFHAFRPIEPNNPVLPSDADRGTSSETLWFDLLAQLREQLRGQLARYRVPVQSEHLSAAAARDEVIRVAGEWSAATQMRVTIAIDGIDHAARAETPGASGFLRSLVPPDAVPPGVCFLIAGQDPAAYNYPIWISADERVVRLDLPALRDSDVEALLRATPPPYDHVAAGLARTINAQAQGNTLSVLFSIQEALLCKSVEELEPRLIQKRMTPALDEYYGTIWGRAVEKLPPLAGTQIAAALSLLRGRINGEVLSTAFEGISETQWCLCLEALRPLVIDDEGGYRVLHNDVAVYLHRLLRTREGELRVLAGQLADYLLERAAPRQNVHASVFELLRLADRTAEQAANFTVAFVQEAWELNRPYEEVEAQSLDALESALRANDWHLLHQVVCATKCALRIESCASAHDMEWPRTAGTSGLQRSVPSELAVAPMQFWTEQAIGAVCRDVRLLVAAGEHARAKAVLERWFDGLTARGVLAWHAVENDWERLQADGDSSLVELGECLALTGGLHIVASPTKDVCSDPSDNDEHTDQAPGTVVAEEEASQEHGFADSERSADALLVRGMLSYAARHSSLSDWCRVLQRVVVFYPDDLTACIHPLVQRRAWGHVRGLLERCSQTFGEPATPKHYLATAVGLCIGFPEAVHWASQIHKDMLRLAAEASHHLPSDKIPVVAALGFIWGWADRARLPDTIASELAQVSRMSDSRFNRDGPGLVLCAATTGQALSLLAAKPLEKASEAINASRLSATLRVLGTKSDHLDERERDIRLALLSAVVWVGEQLGSNADTGVALALSELGQSAPGGPLGEAIWHELRRRGADDTLLGEWCSTWIGAEGRAWALQVFKRHEEVKRFRGLSERLGRSDLVTHADVQLLRRVASFQLRKDDALGDALAWFDLAMDKKSEDVTLTALALLGLSRMADSVGEDTLGIWIESSVLRYLAKSGARHLLGLWEASPKGQWLQPEETGLFSGIIEAAQNHELDPAELQAVWCLAIGSLPVEREVNRVILRDLYNALVAQAGSRFEEWSRSATPLEVMVEGNRDRYRLPYPEPHENAEDAVLAGLQAARVAIMSADNLSDTWKALGACIVQTRERGHAELGALVEFAFGLLADRYEGTPWHFDGRNRVYWELARSGANPEHWRTIAETVIGHARKSGQKYRLHCASENLESLCRCVARAGAGYDVRSGLNRQLHLVKAWTGVPSDSLVLPGLESGATAPTVSWSELAIRLLLDRFTTDDALGVSTAIRGLGLLLTSDQSILPLFGSLIETSRPRAQLWESYVLEWLAARAPEDVARTCGSLLQKWLSGDDILLAVQAWATLAQCARGGAGNEPDWPRLAQIAAPTIHVVGPGFLRLPSEEQGALSFVSGHRAARSPLQRASAILGGDVSDLESRANATQTSDEPLRPARGKRGYTRLARSDEHRAVLKVLHAELAAGRWGKPPASLVGQTVAYGDDPFILIGGRRPGPTVRWELLDTMVNTPVEDEEGLKALATELISSGVERDEVVLGGGCSVLSKDLDMVFRFHRRVTAPQAAPMLEEAHTFTARSFALYDRNRFEEQPDDGFMLTVHPAGLYQFHNSTYMVYPSRMLGSVLGWAPNPVAPTELQMDGQVVARYEAIQGPLTDDVWNPEYRNPIVGRWVANAAGWSAIHASLNGLTLDELVAVQMYSAPAR